MNPRKKQILDAAHHLFVKNGFNATSIQDILDEAQIAKGTFYNHFSSKNECLISILSNIHDQAWIMRQELSIGKPKNDQEIFIKQIIVRMKMNKENNLLPLFESAMHSKDDELKTYIRNLHITELNWANERIIEIYGEEAKPHALDYVILLFGIIHHFIHVQKLGSKHGVDLEYLIRFALKRINILYQHQDELKPYFSYDWLTSSENRAKETKDEIRERLIFHLERLSSHMIKENTSQKKMDYIQFLLSECNSETPRNFLIESVLDSMQDLFSTTMYKDDIKMIQEIAQRFIDYPVEKIV